MQPVNALAADAALPDESHVSENSELLRDGGQREPDGTRQRTDWLCAAAQPDKQGPPCRAGDRLEDIQAHSVSS